MTPQEYIDSIQQIDHTEGSSGWVNTKNWLDYNKPTLFGGGGSPFGGASLLFGGTAPVGNNMVTNTRFGNKQYSSQWAKFGDWMANPLNRTIKGNLAFASVAHPLYQKYGGQMPSSVMDNEHKVRADKMLWAAKEALNNNTLTPDQKDAAVKNYANNVLSPFMPINEGSIARIKAHIENTDLDKLSTDNIVGTAIQNHGGAANMINDLKESETGKAIGTLPLLGLGPVGLANLSPFPSLKPGENQNMTNDVTTSRQLAQGTGIATEAYAGAMHDVPNWFKKVKTPLGDYGFEQKLMKAVPFGKVIGKGLKLSPWVASGAKAIELGVNSVDPQQSANMYANYIRHKAEAGGNNTMATILGAGLQLHPFTSPWTDTGHLNDAAMALRLWHNPELEEQYKKNALNRASNESYEEGANATKGMNSSEDVSNALLGYGQGYMGVRYLRNKFPNSTLMKALLPRTVGQFAGMMGKRVMPITSAAAGAYQLGKGITHGAQIYENDANVGTRAQMEDFNKTFQTYDPVTGQGTTLFPEDTLGNLKYGIYNEGRKLLHGIAHPIDYGRMQGSVFGDEARIVHGLMTAPKMNDPYDKDGLTTLPTDDAGKGRYRDLLTAARRGGADTATAHQQALEQSAKEGIAKVGTPVLK